MRYVRAANNADPVFCKLIRVPYHFEQQQRLVARVYDIDSVTGPTSASIVLERQDFIGSVHTLQFQCNHSDNFVVCAGSGEITCMLAQVMGARGATLRENIRNTTTPSRAKGLLTIRGEEVKNANALITLQLSAEALDKKVSLLLFTCRTNWHCVTWLDLLHISGHVWFLGSVPALQSRV